MKLSPMREGLSPLREGRIAAVRVVSPESYGPAPGVIGRGRGWDLLFLVVVALLGGGLFFLDRVHPAVLPVFAPWSFSWPVYLATTLTLGVFARGLLRTPVAARPPSWRKVAFVAGVALIYAVLQTHLDYIAQHLFTAHRLQHLVLHHLGPFLIALGAAGPTLWNGLPVPARRVVASRPVRAVVVVLQQPVIAPFLFVGLIYFWLYPPVHFRAMLNVRLYDLMNWSMAVDGILFWCLVLDPRAKPPARLSFGARALLAAIVMPPQIALGAYIALAAQDMFPVYALCGRIFPISAIADQRFGGLTIWIPAAMMSAFALVLVLNGLRLADEKKEKPHEVSRPVAAGP